MSSLKVTGTRSVIVLCDCGSEHKLSVNKEGEYKLETKANRTTNAPAEKRPVEATARKRTIFDAPLPGNEPDEDGSGD